MYSNEQLSAFIGLGSNLGDRAGNLLLGIRGMLSAGLPVTRLSQIYETEPVDTFPQPQFLNLVAELVGPNLPPPQELMSQLLRIELSLGRMREKTKGPRTIDLDLLLYGDEKLETEALTLPHPRMHMRRFILVPLAELCPNLRHPTLKRTIEELLSETSDRSEVKLWTAGDGQLA